MHEFSFFFFLARKDNEGNKNGLKMLISYISMVEKRLMQVYLSYFHCSWTGDS